MQEKILYPQISLAGSLGSGKSTIAKQLMTMLESYMQELAFLEEVSPVLYSTGDIQRKIAKKLGMNTLELNKYSEKAKRIDHEIDGFTKKLAGAGHAFVIDSRLAWHFIPKSFKVFLCLKNSTAAERVFAGEKRQSELYANPKEAMQSIERRQASEAKRFLKLYAVDIYSFQNYDFVAETSFLSPAVLAESIFRSFVDWHKAELGLLKQGKKPSSMHERKRYLCLPKFMAEACLNKAATSLDEIIPGFNSYESFYLFFKDEMMKAFKASKQQQGLTLKVSYPAVL